MVDGIVDTGMMFHSPFNFREVANFSSIHPGIFIWKFFSFCFTNCALNLDMETQQKKLFILFQETTPWEINYTRKFTKLKLTCVYHLIVACFPSKILKSSFFQWIYADENPLESVANCGLNY